MKHTPVATYVEQQPTSFHYGVCIFVLHVVCIQHDKMKRNIILFTVCCVLCLLCSIIYNNELAKKTWKFIGYVKMKVPEFRSKFERNLLRIDVSEVCEKICNRQMQSCFDPSASILVYDVTDPANMTFKQPNEVFETTNRERETGERMREKWKRKRTLCPVTDINPSFQTMISRESCAIIGNGGFLMDSGCGKTIDAHDFVLRANLEQMNGYTDDVGHKTNMIMINAGVVNKLYDILTTPSNQSEKERASLLRYLDSIKGAILWYPLATDNGTAEKLQGIATVLFKEKVQVKFALSIDSAVSISTRKWNTVKTPSFGLIGLTVAQTFCNDLSLYGFYPYRNGSSDAHYGPNVFNLTQKDVHDFDEEQELLRSLHHKHLLRLVNPCKSKEIDDVRASSPEDRNQNMSQESKLCDKICDRQMKSCFDPILSVLIYNTTIPRKMTFRQEYQTVLPKKSQKSMDTKFKQKGMRCPASELNPSLQTMTAQKNCAIIGNSGILLDSKCGKEIDAHDFVLRANLAKLNGYTDDVGQKTTMMMINVGTVRKLYNVLTNHSTTSREEKTEMLQYLRTIPGAIIWYPKATNNENADKLQEIATVVTEENIPVRFAFSFSSAVSPTRRKWKMVKLPSSGLIALTIAQSFCENITLYGFYPYQNNTSGARLLHHYYQPKLVDFHTDVHDFDKEHKLLRTLHDKHILRLVLQRCKTL